MIAMKITLTKNRQYGGSGKMSCLGRVYLLFNFCYCSPTTDSLEKVMPLSNHCSRFYSHADRNMEENLIVRLEVAVDSVYRLDDSLDRGAQSNADQMLVRQPHYFLHRWGLLAVRAVSYTSVRPLRALSTVSTSRPDQDKIY